MKSYVGLILCFLFLNIGRIGQSPPNNDTRDTIRLVRLDKFTVGSVNLEVELNFYGVFQGDICRGLSLSGAPAGAVRRLESGRGAGAVAPANTCRSVLHGGTCVLSVRP